jgi:deoxyribodipyrimidine photolyase
MDLTTEPGLQEIRDLPEDMLHWAYETLVPSERRLPDSFWARYDETIAVRRSHVWRTRAVPAQHPWLRHTSSHHASGIKKDYAHPCVDHKT